MGRLRRVLASRGIEGSLEWGQVMRGSDVRVGNSQVREGFCEPEGRVWGDASDDIHPPL